MHDWVRRGIPVDRKRVRAASRPCVQPRFPLTKTVSLRGESLIMKNYDDSFSDLAY